MSRLAAIAVSATLAGACGDNRGEPRDDATVGDTGPGLPPTLRVTAPNGGEMLYPAAAFVVTWTTEGGDFASYDVALVDDAGQLATTIATGVTGTTVAWTPSGVAVPTRYTIRVTASGTSDDSDAAFTLVPPATGTSLARDVQPIFSANCLTQFCHTPQAQTAQLVLAPGETYKRLVGVHSTENPCTSYERVRTGQPDQSYLLFKLAGTGPCLFGVRMPKGASALPAGSIATIRAWITEGALDN